MNVSRISTAESPQTLTVISTNGFCNTQRQKKPELHLALSSSLKVATGSQRFRDSQRFRVKWNAALTVPKPKQNWLSVIKVRWVKSLREQIKMKEWEHLLTVLEVSNEKRYKHEPWNEGFSLGLLEWWASPHCADFWVLDSCPLSSHPTPFHSSSLPLLFPPQPVS